MKKLNTGLLVDKYKYLLLLVIIGAIYLLPFYNNNFYVSHDSEPQVARSAAVYKIFLDGQFPPRWAGDLNYSFGVPSPNFFFPMMGYLISLLYTLGFSLESSYKIVMGSAFILSGLAFYYWLSLRFSKVVSFGGGIIYMLAPYHFLNTFVRGQLGEMLAFVFVPLMLYGLDKFEQNRSYKYIIMVCLSYGALIISHNILALLFSIILGLYILVSSKIFQTIAIKSLVFALGLGLSAYFWAPALYEGKYINSLIFVSGYFTNHFIRIENIIYAPWGFGPNINEVGGLAPQIGIVPFLLLIVSLFGLKIRKDRKIVLFWVAVFSISVFFTNEFSSQIWNKFHILEQFQFPWRFMAIISFAAAVLSAYGLSIVKRKEIILLAVVVVLLISTSYLKIDSYVRKPDSFYLNYPGTGAYHGETTTIWTAGDASEYPPFPVEIIAGSGQISNYERKSNLHTFKVSADTDLVIKDNTNYYPGWKVFLNGKEIPIQFQDPNHRGLITFSIPKGSHLVEVKFGETAFRLICNIVSIASLVIIISIVILRKKIDKLFQTL